MTSHLRNIESMRSWKRFIAIPSQTFFTTLHKSLELVGFCSAMLFYYIGPKVFYGIETRRLRRPAHDLNPFDFKQLLGAFAVILYTLDVLRFRLSSIFIPKFWHSILRFLGSSYMFSLVFVIFYHFLLFLCKMHSSTHWRKIQWLN